MGVLNKVREIVFGSEFEDEYEDVNYDAFEAENDDVEQIVKRTSRESRLSDYQSTNPNVKDSKVLSLHTNMQMEVVVTKPESYDDAKEVSDSIKSNKPVIVNLENLDLELSQRLMDFLSGTCYSLGGTIQRISNEIFIIAPANVDLSGDFKEELRSKGILFSNRK